MSGAGDRRLRRGVSPAEWASRRRWTRAAVNGPAWGDGTHYEGVGLCIDALLRLYQLRRDAEHKDDIGSSAPPPASSNSRSNSAAAASTASDAGEAPA